MRGDGRDILTKSLIHNRDFFFLSKVTAITEVLSALPAGDKCLIFSQWEGMLDIVAAALRSNGVEFARLGGQVRTVYVYTCYNIYIHTYHYTYIFLHV